MEECPPEEQLAGFVEGVCAEDEAARIGAHVEQCARCAQWVAEAKANEAILDSVRGLPVAEDGASPATSAGPLPLLPQAIEGYEIIRELHRGGQGVVYQAVQKSTKRKVAIKVLLEGPYASEKARRRFEREIELVASLKHPNIISVFHSGETGEGRQFCVMDYVRGVPLHEYVREKKLTLEEALKLFAAVCDAVNYAHQKGVIHRDLKPSNILVDTDGNPKVLDFGLAKMIGGPEQTLISLTGQVVGTLPYMSPEQARGNPDEIDIRTDVYALGVILYEILTGHYPYPVVGQMADVLKHIAETAPTPPSRSWKSGSGVTQRSAKRIRPGRCPIDDEVETIILRMLAKERERRYQSAGELVRDIGHYLAGEPVEAKRDSGWYVLKKSLRRYKMPVAVGAGFVVLLAASLTAISGLYLQAERARSRAEAAARAEAEQRRIAESALTVAEQREAEAVEAKMRADRDRKAAIEAERIATEQAEALRRALYMNRIAQARNAYDSGDMRRMIDVLHTCRADLRGWEWYRLVWLYDRSSLTLDASRGGITSLAFSPDGRRIVSGSEDDTLTVWDVATGTELSIISGHECFVSAVAFTSDGKRILSGSRDRTLRVWDAATGKEIPSLCRHFEGAVFAAFSPDCKWIVLGSDDRKLTVWNTAAATETLTLRRYEGAIECIAFSPDGTRFVLGREDGMLKVRDMTTDSKIVTLRGYTNAAWSAAFSPDGEQIVSGGADGDLKIWDADTGAEIQTIGVSQLEPISCVAFSHDGTRIASGCWDGTVTVWAANTGAQIVSLHGHEGRITCVAFSPDDEWIATGSEDETVKVWKAARCPETLMCQAHTGAVHSVAFSPDGTRIASGSDDSTVRVWNATSGVQIITFFGHTGGVASVAFSSNGKRIASGSCRDRKNILKVWDVATHKEILLLRGHEQPILCVGFSPDGTQIVSSSLDNTVKIWDARSGAEIQTFHGHAAMVLSAAFSPDGRRVVSTGRAVVKVWDALTGTEMLSFCGHEARPTSAAFSADGARIVSGDLDGVVKIWDSASGAMIWTLGRHRYSVWSVAFSPDGRRIVSGSEDNAVRVWDSETGTEMLTLRGHQGRVLSVAFSPDGRRIASGSEDNTVRVWDTVTKDALEDNPAAAIRLTRGAAWLADQKQYDEAESLYQEALAIWRKVCGNEHPDTRDAVTNLVKLYEAWGKPEQAANWRATLPAEE